MYFDYFARREWGDNYYRNADKTARIRVRSGADGLKYSESISIDRQIEQYFQQIVYSLNQPSAARSYQSVFWNIGYFDKYYFDAMFHEFVFPDEECTKPCWESVEWLQKKFMTWFNKERTKNVLTFPRNLGINCEMLETPRLNWSF